MFYRAEWRNGIWAHAPILMDSGHITEKLCLAATSIGLDGTEETIFCAMPIGTIRKEDHPQEDAFYAFVREEGL